MIDKMQIEKEPDIKDILHAAAEKYNKNINYIFINISIYLYDVSENKIYRINFLKHI